MSDGFARPLGSESILRPLISSFGASTGIQLLTIASGVVLARALGPDGRGELTAVMLWPATLAALGSVGVVEATAFFAARRRSSLGSIVGTACVLGAVQSIVLISTGALIVPFVIGGSASAVVAAAYAFLLFIPLNLGALYLMAVLNGTERFTSFNLLRIVTIAGTSIGMVVLAALDRLDVPSATAVYLVANLATVVTAAWALRRAGIGALAFDRGLLRGIVGFGVRSHTSSVSSALNERLDQLLISLFLVPTKLGLYVIAVTLTSATSLVGSSVSLVALPLVARLEGGNHRFEVARHLILVTVGAALAVTVPMVAFAPELLHVFFGRSYVPAANVARVLLVGGVILSTNRTLGALLKGLGRPLDAGMAEFVALGFTIVGLAALLPMLGLMGAAIASVVAYGVSSAWMMRRAARALEVPLVELVRIRRNDLVAIRELLSALHVAAQRRGARTAAPRGSDTVA